MCASTSSLLTVVSYALVFLPLITQADFGCSLEPANGKMAYVRARFRLAAATVGVIGKVRVTTIANRNLDCYSDYC